MSIFSDSSDSYMLGPLPYTLQLSVDHLTISQFQWRREEVRLTGPLASAPINIGTCGICPCGRSVSLSGLPFLNVLKHSCYAYNEHFRRNVFGFAPSINNQTGVATWMNILEGRLKRNVVSMLYNPLNYGIIGQSAGCMVIGDRRDDFATGPLNSMPIYRPDLGYWSVATQSVVVGNGTIFNGPHYSILSTSTLFTVVPMAMFNETIQAMGIAYDETISFDGGLRGHIIPCSLRSTTAATILFIINGVNYEYRLEDMYFHGTASPENCFLSIAGKDDDLVANPNVPKAATILYGSSFLRRKYIVLDAEEQTITLAPAIY